MLLLQHQPRPGFLQRRLLSLNRHPVPADVRGDGNCCFYSDLANRNVHAISKLRPAMTFLSMEQLFPEVWKSVGDLRIKCRAAMISKLQTWDWPLEVRALFQREAHLVLRQLEYSTPNQIRALAAVTRTTIILLTSSMGDTGRPEWVQVYSSDLTNYGAIHGPPAPEEFNDFAHTGDPVHSSDITIDLLHK
jgi:hypothetical protein